MNDFNGLNGGWYRDRTCDPYHVKVEAADFIERNQCGPKALAAFRSPSVRVNPGQSRPLFAAIAAALFLTLTPAVAGQTVTLGDRPGGYAHAHIKTAEVWLKTRTRVVIAGDQQSAAAIQVVYFAGRGGRICAKPGVMLYFHAGRSRGGAVTNANRRYLGRNLKDGWYTPAKFGIGKC